MGSPLDPLMANTFLCSIKEKIDQDNKTPDFYRRYKLTFIGMEVLKKGRKLKSSVYQKPTNTSLLLHHQSHIDKRYKKSLLKTMLHRAFHLSLSNPNVIISR